MKTSFAAVAFWKYTDMVIQALAFPVMMLLFEYYDWGPFAFFLEAAVQLISCLAWTCYFAGGVPRHRAGTIIRRAFLVVAPIWTASIGLGIAVELCLYSMLLLGPIMGLAYFIITFWEADYYTKARKPFYLL